MENNYLIASVMLCNYFELVCIREKHYCGNYSLLAEHCHIAD